MSTLTTARLCIRGSVQGVGYRWAMVEQARQLGIQGWVRNRRDGSVEAVVQGPPAAVDAIVAWAHRGPPAAVVTGVEVGGSDESGLGRFEQRPTA